MALVLLNFYTHLAVECWIARVERAEGEHVGITMKYYKHDKKLFRSCTSNAKKVFRECLFADDGALIVSTR